MTASTYDQLPYADYCFPHTHPAHLNAVARWMGHPAPDFTGARVLELGCAGGGNLLPMAVDLPGAEFVGIDLSQRQIESARSLAARVGVGNVSFHAMSVLDVDASLGEFDYVLCHGVYSWVPPEVRTGILALCRERLSPGGLAYVSYNTLPGWNVLRVIRDYLLFHTPRGGDPIRRVGAAREALRLYAQVQGALATPMAACLRAEAEALATVHESYLFHEYLEEVNEAFYLADFVRDARLHDLDHLTDADPATVEPTAAGNPIAREQTADFLRNRRFRASILGRTGELQRRPLEIDQLQRFWFSTRAELDQDADERDLASDSPLLFADGDRPLSLREPIAKSALVTLSESMRRPVAWQDLAVHTARRARAPGDIPTALAAQLIEWVHAGLVRVHTSEARYARDAGTTPVASPLAREQALHGNAVTTLRHEQIDVGDLERQLLPLLDGTRDRTALCAATGATSEACDGALGSLALNALLHDSARA